MAPAASSPTWTSKTRPKRHWLWRSSSNDCRTPESRLCRWAQVWRRTEHSDFMLQPRQHAGTGKSYSRHRQRCKRHLPHGIGSRRLRKVAKASQCDVLSAERGAANGLRGLEEVATSRAAATGTRSQPQRATSFTTHQQQHQQRQDKLQSERIAYQPSVSFTTYPTAPHIPYAAQPMHYQAAAGHNHAAPPAAGPYLHPSRLAQLEHGAHQMHPQHYLPPQRHYGGAHPALYGSGAYPSQPQPYGPAAAAAAAYYSSCPALHGPNAPQY